LAKERQTVDTRVIEKYYEREAECTKKKEVLEEVSKQRSVARNQHEELRKKRLEEFMHGFGVISRKLQEIYQMITIGGDAELNVVDSLDPFSEVCTTSGGCCFSIWHAFRNPLSCPHASQPCAGHAIPSILSCRELSSR
jgi:hypothetical protein